ncbi:MAG: alpha/beta hydrolase [Planctomycetota bacterium]|nr:MAG: alpha/beta hydrolase [Planctomycetota bacterium]
MPPSLILLRGLMHESGHWHGFESRLAAALPEWQIQCCDNPGVGDQYDRPAPWSIAAMADDLAQRCGPGPHLLVATSLGAMIAASWAERHPSTVTGLLLLVPSMAEAPLLARLQPRAMGLLLLALARRRAPAVAALVQQMTSNRRDDPGHRRIAAERIVLARRFPPRRAVLLRQLWAASRFRLPPSPPCPARILNSSGDRMVQPACGHIWARRWHCSYHRHPSAGHDLATDAPEWLLRQISDFANALR